MNPKQKFISMFMAIILIIGSVMFTAPSVKADGDEYLIYETDYDSLSDHTVTGSFASVDNGHLVMTTESTATVIAKKMLADVPNRFIFEFKLKVDAYSAELGALAIIYDGAQRVYLGIHSDRIVYRMKGGLVKYFQFSNDLEWHMWRVEANNGHAYVYRGDQNGNNYQFLFDFEMEERTDADSFQFVAERAEDITFRVDFARLRAVDPEQAMPIIDPNSVTPSFTTTDSISALVNSTNLYADLIRKPVDSTDLDAAPLQIQDEILVPSGFVADHLGASVSAPEPVSVIDVVYGAVELQFELLSTQYTLNGTSHTLPVPPQLVDDRLMLPIEPIAEALGYNYLYHPSGNFVLSTGYETYNDYLDDVYLAMKPDQRMIIDQLQQQGLITLEPVILPEGDNVVEDNHHFGWPVAAMLDDTIIVATRRRPTHDGPRNASSGAFYVRSTDAGQTWGDMVFSETMYGGTPVGGMSTIGVNPAGEFFMNQQGTLRSQDDGVTWSLNPNAFDGLTASGNLGPHMLYHPQFDMMMLFTDGGHVMVSPDGWQQWQKRQVTTEALGSGLPSDGREPAAVIWDGNILLLSREFNEQIGQTGDGHTYAMTQYLYRYTPGDTWEDITFETQPSTIIAGPETVWANDTADLIYNPVTGRIEAVQSARRSGGPPDYDLTDDDGNSIATLNLWSIDPDDLLSGSNEWRFDGTLLQRYKQDNYQLDGLHPGGSVVDTVRGVQHIFLYAGRGYDLRNGIFRLTRTLDTDSISQALGIVHEDGGNEEENENNEDNEDNENNENNEDNSNHEGTDNSGGSVNNADPSSQSGQQEAADLLWEVRGDTIQIEGDPNEAGLVEVDLASDVIEQAYESGTGNIHIDVRSSADSRGVVVRVPSQLIAQYGQEGTTLIIHADAGTAAISADSLAQAIGNQTGLLQMEIRALDDNTIPVQTRRQIVNAAMVRIDVSIDGRDQALPNLNVTLPYARQSGESPHSLIAYRMAADGSLSIVKNGIYDPEVGGVLFNTDAPGSYAVGYRPVMFRDLNTASWAQQSIEALAARDIVTGKGDERFDPGSPLTREQFLVLLLRAFDLQFQVDEDRLGGYVNDSWYSEAAHIAAELGIVESRAEQKIGSHEALSRQEMALLLYRALKLESTVGTESPFPDVDGLTDEAVQAIAALHSRELLFGFEDGSFRPSGLATRAQAASLLFRVLFGSK